MRHMVGLQATSKTLIVEGRNLPTFVSAMQFLLRPFDCHVLPYYSIERSSSNAKLDKQNSTIITQKGKGDRKQVCCI